MADRDPRVKLKARPPRERAARALCSLHGNPENMMFQGKPMWMSYLPDVDAVLEAVGWAVDIEPERPNR
jgi:hypothetical protein